MATEHRNIPDPERHEPKGITSAQSGQVYRSNGSASGAWKDDLLIVSGTIEDISTASSIIIPIPVDCTIVSFKAVLGGAITVADANITVTRGSGDTVASFIIPYDGSAEGATVDATPSGNVEFLASTHNYLKIATDGGSTDTATLTVTVKVKVTE